MALPNFTEPKAGMSSAYPRPTPPVGSSDHADLKAMALGIQAWLDGSSNGEPLSLSQHRTSREQKTAQQRTPTK
jgi:hypothetical protein